jgi:hypothetical protein
MTEAISEPRVGLIVHKDLGWLRLGGFLERHVLILEIERRRDWQRHADYICTVRVVTCFHFSQQEEPGRAALGWGGQECPRHTRFCSPHHPHLGGVIFLGSALGLGVGVPALGYDKMLAALRQQHVLIMYS